MTGTSNPIRDTAGDHTSLSRNIERVLVVRLGAMGDVIHGMPAIAALRQAHPQIEIGWVIEERWRELLCTREAECLAPRSVWKPLVDRVHVVNFSVWRKALMSDETWREALHLIHEVQGFRYQAVLDLQGAIRSATVARLSGAPVRVGSARPREALARMLYNRSALPQGDHVIEQAMSLVSALAGETLVYAEPQFPIDPEQHAWAEEFLGKFSGKQIAVLNPGAGWGAKCWPVESFGAVARALHDRGIVVLVNHGPVEKELALAVIDAGRGVAHPLQCSVGELVAILRRTHLFIGGDTGPMHLAAALHVPVVALFGPTPPERNGPYGTRSVVLRNPQSVDSFSHRPTPDQGLISIRPDAVIDAAAKLLDFPNG